MYLHSYITACYTVCATVHNGLYAKQPLSSMAICNGIKDETTAFESRQTNRLE